MRLSLKPKGGNCFWGFNFFHAHLLNISQARVTAFKIGHEQEVIGLCRLAKCSNQAGIQQHYLWMFLEFPCSAGESFHWFKMYSKRVRFLRVLAENCSAVWRTQLHSFKGGYGFTSPKVVGSIGIAIAPTTLILESRVRSPVSTLAVSRIKGIAWSFYSPTPDGSSPSYPLTCVNMNCQVIQGLSFWRLSHSSFLSFNRIIWPDYSGSKRFTTNLPFLTILVFRVFWPIIPTPN